MRILKFIPALFLIAGILAGCASTGQGQINQEITRAQTSPLSGPESRDMNILTSNIHLAHMIQALSGSNHTVDYLAQSGEHLKSIAPDPALVEENDYQAFFYIGAGYEPFIRDFTEELDKNRIYIVNVSRGIDIKHYQMNKLDIDNYYYLTNSTNYKIALNSMKNALTELDPARRTLYSENFVELSRKIDEMQSEIKDYMKEYSDVTFVADSDLVSYVAKEYGSDLLTMTQFSERMARILTTTQSATENTDAEASKIDEKSSEHRIFLYSEDSSIQKYSEDIIRYDLLPVKIHLYDENITLMDSFNSTFREIRKAIETRDTTH